jgi:hypothetical protein
VYYNLSRCECQGVSLENCGKTGNEVAKLDSENAYGDDDGTHEIVEDEGESDVDD